LAFDFSDSVATAEGGDGGAGIGDNEWVEVRDPQSGKVFFANAKTGDCSWEKPENAIM
jgi:hypothetical protein